MPPSQRCSCSYCAQFQDCHCPHCSPRRKTPEHYHSAQDVFNLPYFVNLSLDSLCTSQSGSSLLSLPWPLLEIIIVSLRLRDLLHLRMTCLYLRAVIPSPAYIQCTWRGDLHGKDRVRLDASLTYYKGVALQPHVLYSDRLPKGPGLGGEELWQQLQLCRRHWQFRDGISWVRLGSRICVWCVLCGRLKPRGGHAWTEWRSTCADCVERYRDKLRETWVQERLQFYSSGRRKNDNATRKTITAYTSTPGLGSAKGTKYDLVAFLTTVMFLLKALVSSTRFDWQTMASKLERYIQKPWTKNPTPNKPTKLSLQTLPVELLSLIVDFTSVEGLTCLRETSRFFHNIIPPEIASRPADLQRAEATPVMIKLRRLGCFCCLRLMSADKSFSHASLHRNPRSKPARALIDSEDSPHMMRPPTRFCISCRLHSSPRGYRYRPGQSFRLGNRLMLWCVICSKVQERSPGFCGVIKPGCNGGTGMACEGCEDWLRSAGADGTVLRSSKIDKRARKEAKMKRLGREFLQRPGYNEHGSDDTNGWEVWDF